MISRGGTALVRAVRAIGEGLLDLLWPGVCGGCGAAAARQGRLCEACSVRLLRLVSLPYCPRCGASLGPGVPAYTDGCVACSNPLPRFSRVIRLGPYTQPLRYAIRRLKYRGRLELLGPLCDWLAEGIEASLPAQEPRPEVVVPVPMHWRRRIWRGLDHANLLAEALAGRLRLPVGEELIRIRSTPPQVRMNRTQRIANVRGAFAAANSAAMAGVRVLLVDDVTTTGATANECARTLLRAGAEGVMLAVLAKAEPPTAYAAHWET